MDGPVTRRLLPVAGEAGECVSTLHAVRCMNSSIGICREPDLDESRTDIGEEQQHLPPKARTQQALVQMFAGRRTDSTEDLLPVFPGTTALISPFENTGFDL